MTGPTVIKVQGQGGAVWDLDIPPRDSMAFERLAEQLDKSHVVLLGRSTGEGPGDYESATFEELLAPKPQARARKSASETPAPDLGA